MRDKYYEAALKFCQEHGYEGDELPPFRPGAISENCPITVALEPFGAYASAAGTVFLKPAPEKEFDPDTSGFYPPRWIGGANIATFMSRADDGLYPELGKPHDP